MRATCPQCSTEHDLGTRFMGKLLLGGSVASLSCDFKRDPVGAFMRLSLAVAAGHIVDTVLLPRCPECAAALRLLHAVT